MLSAYFVSCVMNLAGATDCSVSVTEMDTVAKDLITCTQQAAVLQNDAMQQVLIRDLTLVSVRAESGCDTPAKAEAHAVGEFKKLRAQGVSVDLFKF